MCIDEFNGDNFDHSRVGFVGGGYIGQSDRTRRSLDARHIVGRAAQRTSVGTKPVFSPIADGEWGRRPLHKNAQVNFRPPSA